MSRTIRCKGKKVRTSYMYTLEEFLASKNVRVRFRHRNRSFDSYEAYLAFEESYSHTEAAFKCYHCDRSNVPSHVNNCYSERPLRREVKREIHHSLKKDGGESLVLSTPKHMKDMEWWYW